MRRSTWVAMVLVLAVVYMAPSGARAAEPTSPWSIGTSLTFPLVRIYPLYINYRIDPRHELVFGPCFQNYRHESFTAHAYTLILGYRYYVRGGFSVEAEVYPAYNRMYSHVTDEYYAGWEMWAEIKAGYTFDLAGGRFYLQVAPGIGFGLFQTNTPPGFEDEIESPIFVPQVIIGLRL